MCVSDWGPSALACREYVADFDWMDRSGNVCWGMGAANEVPCVNCGVKLINHWIPFDDEEEDEFWC